METIKEYPVINLITGKELSPEDSAIVQQAIRDQKWHIVVQYTQASPGTDFDCPISRQWATKLEIQNGYKSPIHAHGF